MHERAAWQRFPSDKHGARLREERERLGMTQPQMAQAAGVSLRGYCYYEQGERQMKACFLSSLAYMGVDVIYVLTGMRNRARQTGNHQRNQRRL